MKHRSNAPFVYALSDGRIVGLHEAHSGRYADLKAHRLIFGETGSGRMTRPRVDASAGQSLVLGMSGSGKTASLTRTLTASLGSNENDRSDGENQ